MSDYLQPRLYNGRGLENQLLNSMYNSHDLCCGCNNTAKHLIHLLQGSCRHFADASTTTEEKHGDAPIIDTEDLETVFAATDEQLG